jgi:lipid-A-disaccharide synthase
MERMGFHCLGYAEEMAVMGFSEVIKHYSEIKKVFKNIIIDIEREKPDLALLLDYPGFNLKLCKELHQRGIPVVYYISPQIWAWKKNRIYTIKAFVTKMLVVFPFEVEFYHQYRVPVEYVGHPLLDELHAEHLDMDLIKLKRGRLGITPKNKVLGLMPGSRKQEIERHLQDQIAVAQALCAKHSDLKILLLVAPTLAKEYIQNQLHNLQTPISIIQDEPFNMISLTDAVLAASGTATLMVGLLEKPMVIMYKVSWFSAFVGRRLVKGFFGLVNLLSQREIVPEVFQEQATPQVMVPLMDKALYDIDYRQTVIKDLRVLKLGLGEKGVTERVARAINKLLQKKIAPKEPS